MLLNEAKKKLSGITSHLDIQAHMQVVETCFLVFFCFLAVEQIAHCVIHNIKTNKLVIRITQQSPPLCSWGSGARTQNTLCMLVDLSLFTISLVTFKAYETKRLVFPHTKGSFIFIHVKSILTKQHTAL